ncbi:MAG TPA: CBS domain-containing protein [Casimicrobiaceae bacterium]|jgi:CBS domain-containing protein
MRTRTVRAVVAGRPVVGAPSTTSVEAAARLMKRKKVGALMVVDEGRLVGIFTERDALFRVIADDLDPRHTRLDRVMTRDPRTIDAEKPFAYALMMMHEGGFRHVPVIARGELLGMVTARDALAPELEEFRAEMLHREEINKILG